MGEAVEVLTPADLMYGRKFRKAFHDTAWLERRRALDRRRLRPNRSPVQEIIDGIHLNNNRLSGARMTFIYFIRCGEFVKIGRSDNAPARLRELQRGAPMPLSLIGAYRGFGCDETALHHAFAADRHCGEWFRSTPLLELVARKLRHPVFGGPDG